MKTLLTAIATLLVSASIAETRIVNVGDFYFQDQVTLTSTTTVSVGDTVRWIWVNGNHTTTSEAKIWNAAINSITTSYQRVFDTPGEYRYFCAMDPLVMRGTVFVDGLQTHVPPSGFDVQPGVTVSGSLGELLESDNKRLILRPGIVFSAGAYPIVVRVSGQVPPGTGENSLTFRVESRGSNGSILQRLRIYNPFKDVWVEIGTDLITTSDGVYEATVNDPENYMTPATGTVVADASYKVVAPVFSHPWQAEIDLIEWIAQ